MPKQLAEEIEKVRKARGCRTIIEAARLYRGLSHAELAGRVGIDVDVLRWTERTGTKDRALLFDFAVALAVPSALLRSKEGKAKQRS